ncbi:hypothetical protein [Psychrobacillus vulpis]|uniref:hypothetical protein n=1 Tax=Psychrobacillus vulpis TaxID=2325572 RepID=UPI00140AF369|nr:hypothetical protein [Psychrobacillus vulpis]
MGLNEHNVTMKVSSKRLNTLTFTHARQKVQTTLQWMILKKARPPKLKYIPIPPRD